MAKGLLIALCLVAVWASHAWAEFYVCGDTTALQQYFYRDPSVARPGNCSQVGDNDVDAQLILIQSTPQRYLKVVSGLATLMTTGEQNAVDAANTALNTARQMFVTEVGGNAICSAADLTTVDSVLQARHDTLQGSIDAISTNSTAVLKAALSTVNDELLTRDKIIARCLRALRVVR